MEIEKRITDTPEGKVVTFVVDGEELTQERLSSFLTDIEVTKKETLRDYHSKTQSLADEKKQFEDEKARINSERESFTSLKEAFEKDKTFYLTHDVSEWGKYQSEFKSLTDRGGQSSGGSASSGEVSSLKEALAEMKRQVSSLQEKTTRNESETLLSKADNSLKFAKSLLTTFPLADIEVIQNQMYKHFHETSKIPTEEEVKGFVKKDHEKKRLLIEKHAPGGGKPPEEIAGGKELFPSKGTVGGGGIGKEENIPRLTDTAASIKAGVEFFRERSLARK